MRPDFEERTGAQRIELGPLSAADVQKLVDELLGGEISDEVRDRSLRRPAAIRSSSSSSSR